jgi:hypothetical protein
MQDKNCSLRISNPYRELERESNRANPGNRSGTNLRKKASRPATAARELKYYHGRTGSSSAIFPSHFFIHPLPVLRHPL